MKFCDIMLCCGVLCVLNAICLAICFVVPGWWVCKCLFVGGANVLIVSQIVHSLLTHRDGECGII